MSYVILIVAGLEGQDGEDQGYYAPLERVLKDEARHVMSRIDVHEYVIPGLP